MTFVKAGGTPQGQVLSLLATLQAAILQSSLPQRDSHTERCKSWGKKKMLKEQKGPADGRLLMRVRESILTGKHI